MIVMINEVEDPLGAGDMVAGSVAVRDARRRGTSRLATRRELGPDIVLPDGYPIDGETASVAEAVSGETSSEGTSRI